MKLRLNAIAPLACAVSLSLNLATLAGCTSPVSPPPPVTPEGAPAQGQPGAGTPQVDPEPVVPTLTVSGAATHAGKPLANVQVQIVDALTGKPLRPAPASAAPSGKLRVLAVGGGLAGNAATTDGQGHFQLSLAGLSPGRAVRVVVSDRQHRVETTLTGLQAAAGPLSGLAVDDAATAQSVLARGLLQAAGTLVGADHHLEAVSVPLRAVEHARQGLAALAPALAQALASHPELAEALTSPDAAAVHQQVMSQLGALLVALSGQVGPDLAAVAGPQADPASVLRRRATLAQALAKAQPDFVAVLARLSAECTEGEWPAFLARFDGVGSTPLLGALAQAAQSLPASARSTELAEHVAAAQLHAGIEEFAALVRADEPGDRRHLGQRLLSGGSAQCVAVESATRLNLTSNEVQSLLSSALGDMDAVRALPIWQAIAADATLSQLAGGLTASACADPTAQRKALHTLFDALAAKAPGDRQAATAGFVALAARDAEFQGQLGRRLAQMSDDAVSALLTGLAPLTAAQVAPALAAAYDVKAGNLTGQAVPADAFPDSGLSPVVAELAQALSQALADVLLPAQEQALRKALESGDLTKKVEGTLADATLALVRDIAHSHAQTAAPLAAPIAFPGTRLELRLGADARGLGATNGLLLENLTTGRTVNLTGTSDTSSLFEHRSGGGSSSSSSAPAPVGLSLTGMDYAKGWPGRTITLYGTGFSATADDDRVVIGDAVATVTAATTTSLSVTVPDTPGDTTVHVTVGGESSADKDFHVFANTPLLSGLTAQATALPAERDSAACVKYGQDVYVVGGEGVALNSAADTVQLVKFRHDTGATPGFVADSASTLTSHLNQARYGASAVIVDDRLYVFGGRTDNNTLVPSAEYADIDPATGALSAFTTMPADPLLQRSYAACVALNGYIYLVGGDGDSVNQARATDTLVRLAVLNTTDTDTAGGLAAAESLSSDALLAHSAAALALSGDHAFLVGGYDTAGGQTAALTRLTFTSDGNVSVTDEAAAAANLTQTVEAAAVILNRRLYVIGGMGKLLHLIQFHELDASDQLTGALGFESGVYSDDVWPAEYSSVLPFGDGTIFSFGGVLTSVGTAATIGKAELDDILPSP